MDNGRDSKGKDEYISDLESRIKELEKQVRGNSNKPTTECFDDFKRAYETLEETVKSSGANRESQQLMMRNTNALLSKYVSLTNQCYTNIDNVRQKWGDAARGAFQKLRQVDSIKTKGIRVTQHITKNMDRMQKAVQDNDEEAVIAFSELIQKNVAELVAQIDKVTQILTDLEHEVEELTEQLRQSRADEAQQFDETIQEIKRTRYMLAGLMGAGKAIGWFALYSVAGVACFATCGALGLAVAAATAPAAAAAAAAAPVATGVLAVAVPVAGVACLAEDLVYVGSELSTVPGRIREAYNKDQAAALEAASEAFEAQRHQVQQEWQELEEGLQKSSKAIGMGKQILTSLKEDAQETGDKAGEVLSLAEDRRALREKVGENPENPTLRETLEEATADLRASMAELRASGVSLGDISRLTKIGQIQGDHGRRIEGRGARILAIDGGGVKGVVPARLLEEIESQMQKPIRECFDLICGTSTGGLLALLLTFTQLSAAEIRSIFERGGRRIFSNKSYVRMLTKGHKYTKHGLEGLVRDHVGDSRMRSVQSPHVFVTSTVDGTHEMVFLFRNYKQGARSWHGTDECRILEAARATSAAPTFLPEVRFEVPSTGQEHVFKDGGLLYNNPAGVGLQEGLELFDGQIALLVSLGCGKGEPLEMRSDLWSFLTGELPEVASATERTHSTIANLVQGGRVEGQQDSLKYFRLNPKLREAGGSPIKMDIDSVDQGSIAKLLDVAENFIANEPVQPIQFGSGACGSGGAAASPPPLSSPQCALYDALR